MIDTIGSSSLDFSVIESGTTHGKKTAARRLGLQYLGVLGLLVAVNLPTLARGPAPSEACGTNVRLLLGLTRFQNCDAPGFTAIAQDPSSLFSFPGSQTITRPVVPTVAYVINNIADVLTLGRFNIVNAPDGSTLPEFGFVVFNLLVLAFAVLVALRFIGVTTRQWPPAILFFLLLAANPITRGFLWTAHLQVFNIAMPVVAAGIGYLILRRTQPLSLPHSAFLGFGLGFAVLAYANMAVVIGVAVICLLAKRWIKSAVLLVSGSVTVIAVWAGIALRTTGSFTSVEARDFDQFVWILKLPNSGDPLGIGVAKLGAWMITFTDAQTIFSILVLLLLLVLATYFLVSNQSAQVLEPKSAWPIRNKLAAVLATLAISSVFYLAMGFYQTRLSWMLITGLILATGIIAHAFSRSLRKRDQRLFSAAVLALASAWYGYWLLIPGPWH